MNLEGSLGAFSLPDIFQLLSFTKKDGGLHLAIDGSDGVVYFSGGSVTGASADGARQLLARRLVGAGAVDDESLGSAVERATNGEGVGVVRALLESGAADADLLRQAVTEQAVDAIFDLLRWENGDFAFVVDEANPDDVGVALSVEQVLADAAARREAWEGMSESVPSPHAVLAMPVVLTGDPAVSREEWALLALIDGRRTVDDLVDLTGSGRYAVVSTLAALVGRGLLRVDGDDEAPADHVSVVQRRLRLLAPLEGEAFTPVVDEAPASGATHEAHSGEHVPTEDVPTNGSHPAEVGAQGGPAAEEQRTGPGLAVTASIEAGPEAQLPKRQGDVNELLSPAAAPVQVASLHQGMAGVGDMGAATAVAIDPQSSVIERDPNVNRSLMLRLIAGVRGL